MIDRWRGTVEEAAPHEMWYLLACRIGQLLCRISLHRNMTAQWLLRRRHAGLFHDTFSSYCTLPQSTLTSQHQQLSWLH